MNTLKKHVGPLPVWGWGAAIALGVLIFYWQRNNGGAVTAASNVAAQPYLDPTEGAFPLPSGISSGGAAPEIPQLTSGDIADAVAAQLIPALSTIPVAAAPGEPSNPGDGIEATLGLIQGLKDAGLIQTLPAASTGAATSKAQPHTQPKHVSERVNRSPSNPRKGQTYRVLVNPKGHPKGTYHVYGRGKTAKYIRIKK
jgi:hypothetical protein